MIPSQQSDENRAEEEEQTKVVPKWKASAITQVLMEPDPEDEEEETKAEDAEAEGSTTGEAPAEGQVAEDGKDKII